MAENDDKQITGEGGPAAAEPQPQPDNVVKDNTGQIPVQPVATSDPTIDDNTNPKVFFDGADPRNIPPADSNEQLHIAAGKRIGAELGNLGAAGDKRREAVEAAYDNSRDVREVLGEDKPGDADTGAQREAADAATRRAAAQSGNRAQPPSGRAPKPAKSTTQG